MFVVPVFESRSFVWQNAILTTPLTQLGVALVQQKANTCYNTIANRLTNGRANSYQLLGTFWNIFSDNKVHGYSKNASKLGIPATPNRTVTPLLPFFPWFRLHSYPTLLRQVERHELLSIVIVAEDKENLVRTTVPYPGQPGESSFTRPIFKN